MLLSFGMSPTMRYSAAHVALGAVKNKFKEGVSR
jgi:hypothetical protein